MTGRRPVRRWIRANGLGLGALGAFVALGWLGLRLVSRSHGAAPPRRAPQFTIVNVQTVQPPKPPPPQPPEVKPQIQPKIEEPQTRVHLKPSDFTPPDASRPAPSPSGAGRLSLAAEGEGPGDAFDLAGNPGGRGILTGGGLGDGSGDGSEGLGSGGGFAAKYGWYYAQMASELEEAFRRQKGLTQASARVELRVWADPSGRIQRVQLVKSTGDPSLDGVIQSVVGLRLRNPPPADIPMPMIARLTARRAR